MKILIVEEETDLLDVLEQYLKMAFASEPCEIETATDFRQAAAKIASNEYELVVSDVRMPYGSGIDLVPLIRARCSRTAIALMSGNAEELPHDADVYLRKPFTLDAFREGLIQAFVINGERS